MVLAIAELVDADPTQPVEACWIEALGDDALDDIADGPPTHAHQFRDRGLVGELRQVGNHLLTRQGESATKRRPGDLLDPHAAARTRDPPHRVLEEDLHRAEGQCAPEPGIGQRVVPRGALAALAAAGLAPHRSHGGYESARTLQTNASHDESGDSQQGPK